MFTYFVYTISPSYIKSTLSGSKVNYTNNNNKKIALTFGYYTFSIIFKKIYKLVGSTCILTARFCFFPIKECL